MTMSERWDKVREALETAVSIGWEGCHKIYVAMDEGQHDEMRDIGYDMLRVADLGTEHALAMLQKWYSESCGLRFINAVRSVVGNPNEGFSDLIPQFAEEADE